MRKTSYITAEEFDEFIDEHFVNDFDKAYYYLVYEGIDPEEALELTPSEVDGCMVRTPSGAYAISDRCVEVLQKAMEQMCYRKYNPQRDDLIEVPVYTSRAIIKFARNAGEEDREPSVRERHDRILFRFYRLKKVNQIDPRFNERNIHRSGMVARLEEYIRAEGGNVDHAYEKYFDRFSEVARLYGVKPYRVKNNCIDYLGAE